MLLAQLREERLTLISNGGGFSLSALVQGISRKAVIDC